MQEENRHHESQRARKSQDHAVAARLIQIAGFDIDVIAHKPAQRVTDYACKEHTSGEECRLFQVKIVTVKKEQRYPRQVEPKRPAITKINEGDGKHAPS